MRQAHERQVGIEFRHRKFFFLSDLSDAWNRREDRYQIRRTGEDQAVAALCGQREIASKLNRVAGALFRIDQQCLVGYRLAVPFGMRRAKPVGGSKLIFGEAACIISELQQAHAEIDMRLRVVRLKLDGALPMADGFMQLAPATRYVTQAVKSFGLFRLGLNDLLQISRGLLVVLGVPKGHAEMKSSVGKFRLQRDTLPVRSYGFLELALLIKLVAALEMKSRRASQFFLGRQHYLSKSFIR